MREILRHIIDASLRTSDRVRLPLALQASVSLSLVWPRESNQREGHPGDAVSRHPAFRLGEGAAGFVECTSVYMQRTGAHRARQPAAFPSRPRRTTGAPLACIVRAQARAKHRAARALASAARMPPNGALARRRASQALWEKPAGSRRWIAAIAKQCMDALSERARKAEKHREPGAQDARKALCRGVLLLVTFLCTSKEKLHAQPKDERKLCIKRQMLTGEHVSWMPIQ